MNHVITSSETTISLNSISEQNIDMSSLLNVLIDLFLLNFSGGFMLVQSPEGKMEVIDFREVAPSQATKNMFGKDRKASITVMLPK